LRRYQKKETKIVDRLKGSAIKSNIERSKTSRFEAMLNLISFNKKHPYLLTQERQIVNSKQAARINWKKTIDTSVPIQVGDNFLFLDLVGKKNERQSKDFLLMIFYSLLREFKHFDPTIIIDSTVETYSLVDFEKIKQKATLLLKKSRSAYFSDKFRQLHALLQAYFFSENATYNNDNIEYLLADNFQVIFEDIVDDFLSDQDLLLKYKNLKDGKVIDHLFVGNDVFGKNKIIYIGDSKYYKDPSTIKSQRHKQFTYARNIRQEILVPSDDRKSDDSKIYRFRDEKSEGYNVIPNFFVFGEVEANYREREVLLELGDIEPETTHHFTNRLFDRETLHVLYFRIDFIALSNFYIGAHERVALNKQLKRQILIFLIAKLLSV